jgi:uncharacterized oxidoreductase
MCEILAGCLAGSPTAEPPGGQRGGIVNGMLSIYLDPDHFVGAGFAEAAHHFARRVRATSPIDADRPVLVPGDVEAATRAARLRDGVPLEAETWAAILATGELLGVARPDTPSPDRHPGK